MKGKQKPLTGLALFSVIGYRILHHWRLMSPRNNKSKVIRGMFVWYSEAV